MSMLAGRNGEDRELDVVADGEAVDLAAALLASIKTARTIAMTASLNRAIQRDPNPNGRWKGAILSTDGCSLLIDTGDGRSYTLTVQEN